MADTDTSPGLLDIARVAPIIVKNTSFASTVTIDVYANRVAAATAGSGSIFYASDQVALYLSDGANWLRIGPSMPGDIIWTNEATARSGYVLLTGQAWPGTGGIYTELFALWGGATLPDVQGRTIVAKGTHADVTTLLSSDGIAVANRRPKHRHTPHSHGAAQPFMIIGGVAVYAAGANGQTQANTNTADGGSGNVNDSLDAPAWIVLQPQAKL